MDGLSDVDWGPNVSQKNIFNYESEQDGREIECSSPSTLKMCVFGFLLRVMGSLLGVMGSSLGDLLLPNENPKKLISMEKIL